MTPDVSTFADRTTLTRSGNWELRLPSKELPGFETESFMAKFITVGYGDEHGYKRTDPSVRDAAHAHDARLKAGGALIGVAGAPVQVRNHDDAGMQTTAGAYLHSSLPIAGFAVIEAKDLHEAIMLVSKSPCAVAHGVVEVWPIQEMP